MQLYRAFGRTIESTLPLPELPRSKGKADIRVVRAHLEAPPEHAFSGRHFYRREGDSVLLAWRGYATIRVRDGREIHYNAAPQAQEGWLRQCVLGPALGVLLHQRGLLMLHASAVDIGGHVAAFVGDKGAGKSTTTAALLQHGSTLISDDLVAVDVMADGPPTTLAGLPYLKLWRDTAEAVEAESLSLIDSRVEKRIWSVGRPAQRIAFPLRRLFVLRQDDRLSARRLSAKEAFSQVVHHVYALRFLGVEVLDAVRLKQLATFLAGIEVYELSVRRALGELSHLAQFLKQIATDRVNSGGVTSGVKYYAGRSA